MKQLLPGKNVDGIIFLKRQTAKISVVLLGLLSVAVSITRATDLYIGTASANITPDLPAALMGQFNMRIAHSARNQLAGNVVVLETRNGATSLEQTVFVACDLVFIPTVLTDLVRRQVHAQVPELDVKKIVISATHTHTSPVIESGSYPIPKQGVTQPEEYQQLFAKRVSDAIVKAWKARKPGTVTWALTTATIGHNRRAIYLDKTATMYGKTSVPEFQNLEGYEDHDVNSLFFWNKAGKLIATSIEVPCPAQEVEHDTTVDADYWDPVRTALKKRFSQELLVMGWCGAAGDQSPHLMYRKGAEERMRSLAKESRIDAISRRIVYAVEEAYETVKNERHADVVLTHKTEMMTLPMRIVLEPEYKECKTISDAAAAKIEADPAQAEFLQARYAWNAAVVERFEQQKTNPKPTYNSEIHVIRLGDIVICTNQFEMFTDFGIRIQSRSKAVQTFMVQLAGPGSYLPTSKAVAGGGYSAICMSNLVGPEGGQMIVDHTVKLIDEMWQAGTQ
ncbi:MAG: hypothetical protein ABIN89_12170 [Chitinophagaceae bacterium]